MNRGPASRRAQFNKQWEAGISDRTGGFSTLCDPIDGSPPGSPVPGILQASPAESEGNEGFPPPPDKDLESQLLIYKKEIVLPSSQG